MSIAAENSLMRPQLSTRGTTVFAGLAAVSFSAASSAPTPLYHLYQSSLHLTPFIVTVIFAAYVLAMLVAFLTVARLSDYVGRRPMILTALILNALALATFALAGSAAALIAARLIQGAATGIALSTLGATIADTDPRNGATLNSVTAFIGLTSGALLTGALVAWAPWPMQLSYLVLLALTVVEILALAFVPETTTGKRGAWGVLVPHISVPKTARGAIVQLLPLNLAAWALGGFYLSLMPSLVTVATGVTSLFIGAAVVSSLTLTATIAVLALQRVAPATMVRLSGVSLAVGIAATLVAVHFQSVPGMFMGTVIAGIGFGAAYAGIMRTLLPLAGAHERAGLLAAYFVESYLSFALPAIAAGLLAPQLGLIVTSYVYGAVLIALTLLSVVVAFVRKV